jgi:hypothetical protein
LYSRASSLPQPDSKLISVWLSPKSTMKGRVVLDLRQLGPADALAAAAVVVGVVGRGDVGASARGRSAGGGGHLANKRGRREKRDPK